MWEERSAELNTECKLLQTWNSSMRTCFIKLTKLKSGDGTHELMEKVRWILSHFDFLRAHITQHRGKQVGGQQAKLATSTTVNLPVSESEEDEEDNSQRSTPVPGTSTQQDTPPPPREASPVQETSQNPRPRQHH